MSRSVSAQNREGIQRGRSRGLYNAGKAALALGSVDDGRAFLDEGAQICKRLAAEHPYNENYVLRLLENREHLAIELGFDRAHALPDDPDWSALGSDERFRALIGTG